MGLHRGRRCVKLFKVGVCRPITCTGTVFALLERVWQLQILYDSHWAFFQHHGQVGTSNLTTAAAESTMHLGVVCCVQRDLQTAC